MKSSRLVISLILFILMLGLCQQIVVNSFVLQEDKLDAAELDSIKYGIFSINSWKEKISFIMTEEINKFDLDTSSERKLKGFVELQLNALIDKVDQRIRDSNRGSAKGWFKQKLMNIFVDIKEIKKGIPEYADTIIAGLTKAKTEQQLKKIVNKKVKQYIEKTFDEHDTNQLERIIARTETTDIEAARNKLKLSIDAHRDLVFQEALLLIVFSILIFGLAGFKKVPLVPAQYFLMLGTLILLLLVGVSTPMIDLEAKISELSFFLLDHPVKFIDQVLYFQTKSILDVFWIMMTSIKPEMKLVGILLVTFSIFFPLLKLLSSVIYFYDYKQLRKSRVIQFFVLKSGKWSMADVLVIAIFMAYIGFNGIVTSQFGKLNSADQEMVILTTNGTSLQPGFYIFFLYVMLALVLSGMLTRRIGLEIKSTINSTT